MGQGTLIQHPFYFFQTQLVAKLATQARPFLTLFLYLFLNYLFIYLFLGG
jgi:hypothetical protein